jgi:putative phage-type endonuclease
MSAQQVNLKQGSPEWLAFRREHCGASEAPMMLGLHANVKRTDLLRMKKLGSEQEFSDYVQRNILDKGHDVEALARTRLELLTFEDFNPKVFTSGKLSASLDGITDNGKTIFEHKQLNAKLIEAINQGTLPDQYMAQVQQQLMLTNAEQCVFVCSDGTSSNWHEIEVTPDENWFTRIRAGWDQFLRDLETYQPEEIKQAPVAASIDSLPALNLVVTGGVQQSNLPMFKSAVKNLLSSVKTELVTDQDFVDAENMVKFLKEAESRLETAKEAALAQTADIAETFSTINDLIDQMKKVRLHADKQIKTEKENRKTQLLSKAVLDWTNAIKALNDTLSFEATIMVNKPDFAGAIKGKRNLSSIQDALDTLLANAKIEATTEADRLRNNLKEYHTHAHGYEYLFNDIRTIIQHPTDALIGIIQSRIAEHKAQEQARLDAERERIRLEEQQRLAEQDQPKQPVKAEIPQAAKPATPMQTKAFPDNPRLSELDAWYEHQKSEGKFPISDIDVDVFIWPLILEAYNMGKRAATKAA